MSFFEDAIQIYAEITYAGIHADNLELNTKEVIEIPHAEKLGALLIKGKNGKRFRITGLEVNREK